MTLNFTEYMLYYKLNPNDHWRHYIINALNENMAIEKAKMEVTKHSYSDFRVTKITSVRIL